MGVSRGMLLHRVHGRKGQGSNWGWQYRSPPPNPFLSSGWLVEKRQDQACPHHPPATGGLLTPLQNTPIQQCLVNGLQLSSIELLLRFIHINAHILTALSDLL